jgi:serine/threonine protein kinase
MLHQSLPGGAIGVRLAAALEVLVDVAYAVQYLHSMQLVHGDLRLENVLLKTDRARPLGVTPKLADFGLTRILSDAAGDGAGAAPSSAAAAAPPGGLRRGGGVAHLAPEALLGRGGVTTAVDAYAFGVAMYEVYTSKRAFANQAPDAVAERVVREGARPRFPSSAPAAFVRLAQACWVTEPGARPAFGEIAERLERIAEELSTGRV